MQVILPNVMSILLFWCAKNLLIEAARLREARAGSRTTSVVCWFRDKLLILLV